MKYYFLIIILFVFGVVKAQISEGVYVFQEKNENSTTIHEIKVDATYLVYTVYEENPAQFISTMGGFYSLNNNLLEIKLEFNSNFDKDGLTSTSWPIELSENEIHLKETKPLHFKKLPKARQELDGKWLFATRGPDEGQERRGEEQARKTMKFLIDGHFQWIAYQTETFKFSGTGGGTFSSKDGIYKEEINFFSRDNNRVGATLEFTYEVKGSDWHHKGKNSKGEPMYEIWSRRE